MNRFGYLPDTTDPKENFYENMYANEFGLGQNHFGQYNPYYSGFGYYNNFGYNSDSDSEDSSFNNNFGYNSDSDSEDSEEEEDSAFGKKLRKVHSDAKRAMRMAHNEGISLKEAWKRVKGGRTATKRKTTKKKTSTKKTTKRKTTKKKSSSKRSSDAKRAMKLKHQKGISLKKAWAIVKKGK